VGVSHRKGWLGNTDTMAAKPCAENYDAVLPLPPSWPNCVRGLSLKAGAQPLDFARLRMPI